MNFSQEFHRNLVSNEGFFVAYLQHETLKNHFVLGEGAQMILW